MCQGLVFCGASVSEMVLDVVRAPTRGGSKLKFFFSFF